MAGLRKLLENRALRLSLTAHEVEDRAGGTTDSPGMSLLREGDLKMVCNNEEGARVRWHWQDRASGQGASRGRHRRVQRLPTELGGDTTRSGPLPSVGVELGLVSNGSDRI